jgi:hypothetical protein
MALTLENINIGTLANDGTGDPLRVAFTKINNAFAILNQAGSGGPPGALQYTSGNFTTGSSSLIFDSGRNQLNLNANLIPITYADVNIGNANNTINGMYLSSTALYVGNIHLVESGNTISFPVTGDAVAKASLAGLNNISLLNNLNVGNSSMLCTTAITLDNSVNQLIYHTDPTTFTSMTAKVTSTDGITGYTQTVTLSIAKKQDNSQADFSAHSTIFAGTPLTRYNVDINNNTGVPVLRILVNPIVNEILNHTIEVTTYN